ncbi:hypothetical protein M153_3214000947 [Pseudoloma neurophilia]|uniref:SUN domain-containing protein n=1 Tax=Pseudoloma neurophilia TaxID=146866 RepID=A0A0R0M133_9MICR|nr:hypothetical protein M153_3214000947 [Pseudoloma neurophilia]
MQISLKSLLLSIEFITCWYGCDYASKICGSSTLYSSKNIKRADDLFSNQGYLIGECKPCLIIVKLCNNIKINQISIVNKEFYSSFITKIRFSIFVNEKWKEIGTFNCQKIRKPQIFTFKLENYTNILKVEFLQFDNRHTLFTLNSLNVYGHTLLDKIRISETSKGSGLTRYFKKQPTQRLQLETIDEMINRWFDIKNLSEHTFKIAYILAIMTIVFFIIRKTIY